VSASEIIRSFKQGFGRELKRGRHTTYKEIEKMVYELYGLTEEEMRIVGGLNRTYTSRHYTRPGRTNAGAGLRFLYNQVSG
jgi:hypothetical protein